MRKTSKNKGLEARMRSELGLDSGMKNQDLSDRFSMMKEESQDDQLKVTPYQAYLKAKVKIREMNPGNLKLGIELLKQIINDKPSFVLPYLELHQAYLLMFELGIISKSKALRQGEHYLKIALQLEPNHSECLLQVARVYTLKKGGATKAYTYFEKAMALEPSNAEYYQEYALLLLTEKNNSEALKVVDQAIRLDSISAKSYFLKSLTLYFQGKLEEAIMELDKSLLLKPNYIYAQLLSFRILYAEGKIREAVNTLLALYYSDSRENSDYEKRVIRILIVALQGNYDVAQVELKKLESQYESQVGGWIDFLLMQLNVVLGEYQTAEAIYKNRDSDKASSVILLLGDTMLEQLKDSVSSEGDKQIKPFKVNHLDADVESEKRKPNMIREGIKNILENNKFLNKWAIKR